MGFLSGKKTESLSAEDLIDARGTAKGLTAKEMRKLKAKFDGKTNIIGDARAAIKDVKSGRKTGGVGPAPQPRKGRSMW